MADRTLGSLAKFGRLPLKRAACRPDFKGRLDGSIETSSDRDIERQFMRLHRDAGKSGVGKDPADALFGGKGEGTGIFRSKLR